MAFEIEVKTNAFSGDTFYIDGHCIKLGSKEVLINNLKGFGYMQTQTSVNGIKTSKTFEINLWEEGDKKTVMRFMGAFGGGAANEKYLTITDQLWKYFGDEMLDNLHKQLLQGNVYPILDGIKLISSGIVVRRKPLFKPAYELLIGWYDMNISTFQANLTIKSKVNKKAQLFASLGSKNIWLLYHYVSWLVKNPDIVRALVATANNYELIEKSK